MEQLVPNVINIGDMRTPYKAGHEAFLESHLSSHDPMEQFTDWFQQVRRTPEIPEPNAMCLSTVNKDGAPSSRFVLLKSFSNEGFKFFTNTFSRKGQDMESNPHVALTFYWPPFNRQVRVEGIVEKLPNSEAVAYFESRPFASQVGSAASDQSRVVPNRGYLLKRAEELKSKYEDQQVVPKPPEWGGYLVVPHMIEFWQGQSDRIHDRIVFRKNSSFEEPHPDSHQGLNGWTYERLAP